MQAMQLCGQDYHMIWPADLEEVMCEAQAAAAGPTNTRMSDVSGICSAALTTQHHTELFTAVGPRVRPAGTQGTKV